MQSSDATILLVEAFTLEGVLADAKGNLVNLFGGDFSFAATELDEGTIRLSAQLEGLFVGHREVARRLLEANVSGVETGAAAMAPDPAGSGLYALIDTVDVTRLDADAFRLRVVDFMLFVEYWRSEGVPKLRASIRKERAARRVDTELMVMRA